MHRLVSLFSVLVCVVIDGAPAQETDPRERVRIGIVGLTHDHVNGPLSRRERFENVEIVGITEPNPKVVAKYRERFDLPASLFFKDVDAMVAAVSPQAVAVYTSTFAHRQAVEDCAPHGLHVMMEKPLAVSLEHARAMANTAGEHDIHLLVNYETTWYRSNHEAYQLLHDRQALGPLRKVVVHDGHQGPIEIGCDPNFIQWLTDPVLNGGGALTDFGCYGANLMTWLMKNERPLSVSAVTQQIKPDIYPKVDDEATIILTYPKCQAIIQASWNWPFNRKDMEVYGKTGYAHTIAHHSVRVKTDGAPESRVRAPAREAPFDSAMNYLAAVVRGDMEPQGLSSLENNMIVTEILDAARQSAQTGRRVELKPQDPS